MPYTEISFLDNVLCKMKAPITDGCVLVQESQNTQAEQLCKVTIDGLSNDYICLKTDKAKIQIFSKGYGNKQCDYIILNENNGQKVALFLEMKSTNVDNADARNQSPLKNSDDEYADYVLQLRSSSCLFDYLDSVLSAFCQCNKLGQDYKRHFAVLHTKDIPTVQTGILPIRPVPNISPETAYIKKVVNDAHISFHSLII